MLAARDRRAAVFANRYEAGRQVAERLQGYAGRDDVVVLALPRGGLPVGYEVARALKAPLDVYVVRKLGVPEHEELAMGAIASGGIRVRNDDVIRAYAIPPSVFEEVAREEQRELERREALYRVNRSPLVVTGRVAILVDDGLATGSTMRAAVAAVRDQRPARVIVAVPVGAAETCDDLAMMADVVVCVRTPEPFAAVGYWYQDFSETTDADVRALLDERGKAWAFGDSNRVRRNPR
jgi:predicted phosphoribosyltransferase